MAVSTFGATVALLETAYFGSNGIRQSDVANDAATRAINDAAADVETVLLAVGVQPEALLEVHAPKAYAWLQRTILMGAAVNYVYSNPAAPPGEGFQALREDWQARLRLLRSAPQDVISDASEHRPARSVAEFKV